jgi:hypothetical protein
MARFVQLVDAHTKWIVQVNPNLVRTILPDPSGGTVVRFDSADIIVVTDSPEAVVRKLNDAQRS